MRKIIYLILLVFVASSCSTLKEVRTENYHPVSVKAFLDQPFGVNETVASLKKHFDKRVKVKRMIRRNKHDEQKVDTIVQFYYRKSEVFVYKTYFNREMLLGGMISDNRFPLINGVAPGMKRDDFFKAFTDLEVTTSLTVKLNSKELMREFTFIFDVKGTLKKIVFSSYVD